MTHNYVSILLFGIKQLKGFWDEYSIHGVNTIH